MAWQWNGAYDDLGQVEEFYPAYLAVLEQMRAAGEFPYNDSFRGRVPGIEGPRENTAIYLLQSLRHVRDMEAKVAGYRAAGWRDFDPAEIREVPLRFAGIVEYGQCVGGSGWQEWGSAKLAQAGRSVMVLPGRNRTNGHIVAGRLMVRDRGAVPRTGHP
jgi:hypothetical protein